MNTQEALKNLADKATEKYSEKWYPGKESSQEELIHNYICHLEERIQVLEEESIEFSWIKNRMEQ